MTTIPWSGLFTTSFFTETVVTGSNGNSSTYPLIVVETPTYKGWNTTTPGTYTSITTAVATDIETVTCTEYSCLVQSGVSSSATTASSEAPNSIKTTYLSTSSFSSNFISNIVSTNAVATNAVSHTPSIETSIEVFTAPSVITTNGINRASALKSSGLVILLLQFI